MSCRVIQKDRDSDRVAAAQTKLAAAQAKADASRSSTSSLRVEVESADEFKAAQAALEEAQEQLRRVQAKHDAATQLLSDSHAAVLETEQTVKKTVKAQAHKKADDAKAHAKK